MIIATAGHVDHGKTSLIAALTGVDTDKLPEEKKRGLSIDLGFAYLPVADNSGVKTAANTESRREQSVKDAANEIQETPRTLGFIDVPGHEKFVRNMIAGVGSIDLALLVIAADDGPMPQTREHLAILQLLGVGALVVVISKVDLVEADRVVEVEASIAALLADTVYENALVFPVSTAEPDAVDSKAAIDRLREHLFQSVGRLTRARSGGHFRLAIDRSFHVAGAGTVVTGTVVSGAVEIEDALTVLSDRSNVRVRGIHAQNKSARQAVAGQRCALNLTGADIRKTTLVRGDWVTSSARMVPVRSMDVKLTPVAQSLAAPHQQRLDHWTPAHLHLGAASVPCRIALLESASLEVGEFGLARLICDRPLGAVAGDRLVLRDQSARFTIAGGTVVDPLPPRRGRSRPERLQLLHAMASDTVASALQGVLNLSPCGVDLAGFADRFNCRDEEMDSLLSPLSAVTFGPLNERWAITAAHWKSLQEQVIATLVSWHASNSNALGADQDQLQRAMPVRVPGPVFAQVLQDMQRDKKLLKQAAVYRSPDWQSRLDDRSEALWSRVQPLYEGAGMTAPRVVEIADYLEQSVEDVVRLLNACVAHGRLYKVSNNRYYTPDTLRQLAVIGETLALDKDFSVAAYRDRSGIGRNLVIELLEFFDRSRFTRRLGQQRVVLQPAESVFGS